MLPVDDPFLPAFKATFDASYNPEISQRQVFVESLAPQSTPVDFYDRHIASHLVLKNVSYLPKITQLLSETGNETIQSFLQTGHNFQKANYNMYPLRIQSNIFDDAYSVAMHYNQSVGTLCSAYASKLVLHPDCTSWDAAVFMVVLRDDVFPSFMNDSYLAVIGEHSTNTKIFNNVDESTKDRILHFSNAYSRLASWDVFAMTEVATGMFQSVTRTMPFAWEYPHTRGCRTICNLSPPPDATPAVIAVDLPKVPKFRKKGNNIQRSTTRISKMISVSRLPSHRTHYRANLCHYLQHAWAKAVMHDSTFIILHCGRYERIGFRHRGSQTLYLSGVIDTVNIRNPSYRKLHLGLHVAIVKDAVDRLGLAEAQTRAGPKRPAGDLNDNEAPPSKRRKSSPATEIDMLQFTQEIARRKLAVVTLDYDSFCSPAPSSFVRIAPTCVPGLAPRQLTSKDIEYPKQIQFKAHEYLRITLKKPLGQGAVGVVHPAVLDLTMESGDILSRELVIKLAFSKEQQKLMFNEYCIYGHLSQQRSVEGVVAVHGMFKDPESGALGMLMNHAGQSLRHRELDKSGRGEPISITKSEREAFTRALKSLHEAGVRHNDIRPENLLIGPSNKAYLIDFDRAVLEVDRRENRLELRALQEIFGDE